MVRQGANGTLVQIELLPACESGGAGELAYHFISSETSFCFRSDPGFIKLERQLSKMLRIHTISVASILYSVR